MIFCRNPDGGAAGLRTLAKGVTPDSGGWGRPCPRSRLRSNLSYFSALIIFIIIIIIIIIITIIITINRFFVTVS